MTTAEVIAALAGSSVLSSAITAVVMRRPAMVEAFTESYGKLAQRVTTLEGKVSTLEAALDSEKGEHSKTRDLLRLALRHIRDILAWGAGDRTGPLPDPPEGILHEL
ncbi:MAG: hypothetical protein WBH51_01470 [Mycolicibacter algericus]|uniref:hypothetical protein n=1 Tax=Mycolicibacter algericus TaxID=1288388 RepID=UPI003C753254